MTSRSVDAASGTARELELPNYLRIEEAIRRRMTSSISLHFWLVTIIQCNWD